MLDITNIKTSLENIQFENPKQYIQAILTSFNIPSYTINKLITAAENKSFFEPIYIYRRAVIVYSEKPLDVSSLEFVAQRLTPTYRLLILLSNDYAICKNAVTGEVCEFIPKEIGNHITFFTPLIFGVANEKDLSSTLSFAELVGSLFNKLGLDERNQGKNVQIVDYILSLIYIGFSKSILQDVNIENFFKWVFASKVTDYDQIMKGFFDTTKSNLRLNHLFEQLPYMGEFNLTANEIPYINSESFDLTSKLLCYDLSAVDPEVLGSLVYKLTQGEDNPGIFGHFTSATNVLKLINPLFVSKYEALITENEKDKKALISILDELTELVFLDPTNGPGCFLTSAFSNVANLIARIENLIDLENKAEIPIGNFIGLVENDIAFKLSHLTLWVTYIQYLSEFNALNYERLQSEYYKINLIKGDQLEKDWSSVCPNNGKTLIIGSPLFKGAKKLSQIEKRRMQKVFDTDELGDMDYCSCWLYKAAKYIENSKSKCALVVTNSLCQGAQVPFIWKRIYKTGSEIFFAHTSFKWSNSSKFSTGVTVIIIGLECTKYQQELKYLYTEQQLIKTKCIGPYIVNSTKTIVDKRTTPLSKILPLMQKGNMPYDNQHLMMTGDEKRRFIKNNPNGIKFLKRIVGSDEYINNIERWCLWIDSKDLKEALKIKDIAQRINKVKEFRLSKSDAGAKRLADRPYQFREFRSTTTQTLVIPSVSSENRPYIPIGFVGPDTIVSNLAFAIYNCDPWIFGLISSHMHMLWIRTVCGNLETRLRYSSQLGYNTFPFPDITQDKMNQILSLVYNIVSERENYCEVSLGDLYMDLPINLKMWHTYLDKEIEACYQQVPFSDDAERLKLLFKMYEEGIKQK